MQPRWYAPAWVTLPLAARRCCVRNPVNGVVAELSADQHAVLTACDGCHTIDGHAAAVHRKLGIREGDRATISNWLSDFASQGLFLSLDALLQRFSAPAEWVAPPFAGIVIRTCDRPTLLTRVLASATTLETRVQRRYRYHILDDSRDPANRAINARIVADSALDTHYRDLASNDALVDELTRAFPTATDTIGWLLGPPMEGETTYGRPVNLALLLTAGRRVLMLDDDALLEPRCPPAGDSGFGVSSAPDELFCFADQAEIDHACPPTDVDPFASHLEWLGAPAGSAWSHFANHASATSVVALSGDDASRFVGNAKILLTQNHALGDPGSALFPYHLLTLPPASRQHLLRVAGRKELAFGARVTWRGQLRRRLTPNRPLTLTTLAGLDNSELLPPTVRAHRNEDLLLREMTRRVHAGAWSLDLPWGLPHWRSPAKRWLERSANFRQEPAHFLMDYLDQAAPRIASDRPRDRIHALAAIVLDLAATAERHLVELVEQQGADTASRVQFAIAAAQDDPEVPAPWKDTLRPWLASPTLSTNPAIVRDRLASPATVRAMAKHYGNALTLWPQLWDHAREWASARR